MGFIDEFPGRGIVDDYWRVFPEEWERCSKCNGIGWVTCPKCDGKGGRWSDRDEWDPVYERWRGVYEHCPRCDPLGNGGGGTVRCPPPTDGRWRPPPHPDEKGCGGTGSVRRAAAAPSRPAARRPRRSPAGAGPQPRSIDSEFLKAIGRATERPPRSPELLKAIDRLNDRLTKDWDAMSRRLRKPTDSP
jgi:hypothetical protein